MEPTAEKMSTDLAGLSSNCEQGFLERFSGLFLAIIVLTLVGGRFLWVQTHQPAHLNEITAAFGSVSLFYETPQPDREGNRIAYIQTDEKCLGVFLLEVKTGLKQLVYQKGNENIPLGVWPWSPDDNLFIYSCPDIVLCNGENGQEVARVACGNKVTGLVWLTPESFAYADEGGILHRVQKQAGRWNQTETPNVKVDGSSLSCLSADTIAWREGDRIQALNLTSNAVSMLLEYKPNHLKAFSYSKETGQFLLSCSTGTEGDAIAHWTPNAYAPTPLIASSSAVMQPLWIKAGKEGFAYLSEYYGTRRLVIQATPSEEAIMLFTDGGVDAFTASPDGKKLLIFGVVSNDLSAGMWEYDIAANALHNLVPSSGHPSLFAKRVEGLHGKIKLSSGNDLHYTLFPPANFDRVHHKKYPLLIGNPVIWNVLHGTDGRMWVPSLANCGAYVVIVDRYDYWEGLDQWGTNVLAIYRHLCQFPSIDKSRVFLYASRDESSYVNAFVAKTPELWGGVLLFNPRELPRISELAKAKTAPRIQINTLGGRFNPDDLRFYQETALDRGVVVELAVRPNQTGDEYCPDNFSQSNRTEAITRFIFNN